MGGWISESYMAMVRLNKWFYSGVNSISFDKAVQDLVKLPRSSWLKEHNVAWLTMQNIDSSGNADDLKKRVKFYFDLPDGPPEPSDFFSKPSDNLLLTIQSLISMMAYLMVTEVNEQIIIESERRIKLFLSCYKMFDDEFDNKTLQKKEDNKDHNKSNIIVDFIPNNHNQHLNQDIIHNLEFDLNEENNIEVRCILPVVTNNTDATYEKKTVTKRIPGWISSCNFVCLLNLPNAMRQFGPLRNLWEGSFQGEGYLRIAKKHMKTGLRGNWSYNTLKKVMQEKTFLHLLEKYETNDDMNKNNNHDSYYSYKTRAEAFYKYQKGVPLLIIQQSDGSFGFFFGNGDIFLPIVRESYVCTINGSLYHHWKFVLEEIETTIMYERNILNFCLLLLRYSITREDAHKEQYSLITNNWTEMLEDGTIDIPSIPTIQNT